MPHVRLGLIGGHDFTFDLDDEETGRLDDLITEAWSLSDVLGHALIRPNSDAIVKVSLRDIVCLEITR